MSVRRVSGVGFDLPAVGWRSDAAVRYAAASRCVALAYYLAGRIGLELAYLDGAVAALWPPAGRRARGPVPATAPGCGRES